MTAMRDEILRRTTTARTAMYLILAGPKAASGRNQSIEASVDTALQDPRTGI